MKPNALTGLLMASTSALILFFGWLIKYRKMVSIISGYDEQLCPDNDGLANWAGGTLLKTGLAGLVLAIAIVILPQYMLPLTIVFSLTILGGSLTAAIGINKFKIKDQ